MTITDVTPIAPSASGIPAGLRAAADFLATHLGPAEVVINMKVRGATQADKLRHLEQIASEWGVRTGVDGDGTRLAEVRFGRVRLEAHVEADDMSRRIADRLDALTAAA
jgi:hypothetical protein